MLFKQPHRTGGGEGGRRERGKEAFLGYVSHMASGRFVLRLLFDSFFFLIREDGKGLRERSEAAETANKLTLRCTFSVPSKVKAVRFGVSEIS